MTLTFLVRYQPPELQPLIDDDVAGSGGGARGHVRDRVAWRHLRAPARVAPAERLVAALKPLLNEAAQHGGTAFERDAAVVMRRLEEAVGAVRALAPGHRLAFLELLGRTIRRSSAEDEKASTPDPPRLIVP